MKKLIMPAFMMGIALTAFAANAEVMKGKIVSNKDNMVQIQAQNSAKPTTLRTTPNTRYFEKKRVEKDAQNAEEADLDMNEWVEVIYTVDPVTKEAVIDELIVVED